MTFTQIPRLYAILDAESVRDAGLSLLSAAVSLRDAGVSLLQYRDKKGAKNEILRNARAIRAIFHGQKTTLVLNDWPELALAAGWHGVHVGQNDVAVSEARRLLGSNHLIGVSTHSPEQYRSALNTDADYIAYGPIFGTRTKLDAEPVVGLKALEAIRKLSSRPLIAIGGISQERVESVLAAGADSVAVVSALFQQGQSVLNTTFQLIEAAERWR